MSAHKFDADDLEALAQILESERRTHCQKRTICFSLSVFWLVLLLGAMGTVAYLVFRPDSSASALDQTLSIVQILAILSAAVVTFFTMGWATQNCIHSIERSLFAARAGRHQLFASFLEQLQCADKEKRRLWLEVLKAAVS